MLKDKLPYHLYNILYDWFIRKKSSKIEKQRIHCPRVSERRILHWNPRSSKYFYRSINTYIRGSYDLINDWRLSSIIIIIIIVFCIAFVLLLRIIINIISCGYTDVSWPSLWPAAQLVTCLLTNTYFISTCLLLFHVWIALHILLLL